MRWVFADACYWIALLNPRDSLHEKAVEISNALTPVLIITSEMVLTEVLNAFASKGAALRKAACAVIDAIESNADAEIVPMTSGTFWDAVERYRRRHDKSCGVTDSTSFLIMEERGMVDALSADRDFLQAGFNTLLLD